MYIVEKKNKIKLLEKDGFPDLLFCQLLMLIMRMFM